MSMEPKQLLLDHGTDVVGIAERERVNPYYPPRYPYEMLPGAKQAVMFGIRLSGALEETASLDVNTCYRSAQPSGAWVTSAAFCATRTPMDKEAWQDIFRSTD